MKHWYVVYTQPGNEHLATEHLCNQGFEVYLPLCQKTTKRARRFITKIIPLFPRYLFVYLDVNIQQWRVINSTRGVTCLLTQGCTPAPVPEDVVETLQKDMDQTNQVPLSTLMKFQTGDALTILSGPFAGESGVYEKMSSKDRVDLLLKIMGSKVRITLPLREVGAIK